MWYKRSERHTAIVFILILTAFAVILTGCQDRQAKEQAGSGQKQQSEEETSANGQKQQSEEESLANGQKQQNDIASSGGASGLREKKQRITADSRKIIDSYAHIIDQADRFPDTDTFRLQQDIIAFLGAAGYAAVDTENQIDMVNYEKAEKFCQAAEKGEKAAVTLLLVMDNGGFVRYDLEAAGKKLDVTASSVFPEGEENGEDYFETYTACSWKYTEKGYLFFEQYHMSGFDGPPGQTAVRIRPLDGKCRRLNRKYVLPLGYRGHQLLTVDWEEKDCGKLDFYDLYETMYMMRYGKDVPFPDEYTRVEYEVPEKEFEGAVQTYLAVDSAKIRERAVYHKDTRTYRYRPRGLYDCPGPYEPSPEVTAYEKEKDGKIRLTVEAVWALKGLDRAMTSELVVRPLKDGRFQYVSNRVLSVSEDAERLWYTPRLTDEEWDRLTE